MIRIPTTSTYSLSLHICCPKCLVARHWTLHTQTTPQHVVATDLAHTTVNSQSCNNEIHRTHPCVTIETMPTETITHRGNVWPYEGMWQIGLFSSGENLLSSAAYITPRNTNSSIPNWATCNWANSSMEQICNWTCNCKCIYGTAGTFSLKEKV